MFLSKNEIREIVEVWFSHWNNHDLDSVISFFTDGIVFENWFDVSIKGKQKIRRAWSKWFKKGNFNFKIEGILIDEIQQSAVVLWSFEGPSVDIRYESLIEKRKGLDILYFSDNKISSKLTYSKTKINLNDTNIRLTPDQF